MNKSLTEKPALTFWQIWNMSFGFLGIQFGWGLQMANMSAIYNYLGASPDQIPMLWLAAPMTGLLVQPVIGYMSDRTWHARWGRRKPYFLVGAVLSSLALLAMPNCSALWMAAGLLWILDASINISMEPFRAFVSDMLPERQHARGFAMQSFFIGLGSVIASALPFIFSKIFLSTTSDPCNQSNMIPDSVRWSFYIGAFAFFGAVLFTVLTTKEYPPANDEAPNKGSVGDVFATVFSGLFNMPAIMKKLALVQFFTWMGLFLMWFYFGTSVSRNIFGFTDSLDVYAPHYSALKQAKCSNTNVADFASLAGAVKNNNVTAEQLTNQFGTVAIFESTMSENNAKRDSGNEWGGLCFSFYSLITFFFAMLLPRLAAAIGKRNTHMLCLTIGGLGLLAMLVIKDKYALFGVMTCVGVAWTSILAMPYAMFASHLPKDSVGLFMGIFNFFIVIPEIIAALTFGWVMKNLLHNNTLHAVALGGCFMLIAALLCLRIRNEKTDMV